MAGTAQALHEGVALTRDLYKAGPASPICAAGPWRLGGLRSISAGLLGQVWRSATSGKSFAKEFDRSEEFAHGMYVR